MSGTNFIEIIHLLRRMRFQSYINYFALKTSYIFSLITKHFIHSGFPYSISIEPLSFCNLKCPECPLGADILEREKGKMDLYTFKQIIDQLDAKIIYLNLYFQGEPFLHQDIFEFIKYAHKKGIYVTTSTNGHFIAKDNVASYLNSGLDKLIISIDGLDQQTYEKYRVGGDFQKVKTGIELITHYKKKKKQYKPFTELQFLVSKHNQHQIKEFKQFAKKVKADAYKIKTLQIIHEENATTLLPDNPNLCRYKISRKGLIKIKSKLPNHCWRSWSSLVITWDGNIIPCCFDKDAKYNMGNIKNLSISEIWKSKKYADFHKMILSNRKEVGMCRNCVEGLKL